MASWVDSDVCIECQKIVHSEEPALRCENRRSRMGTWPACRGCYHPACFRGTPDVYGPSQLSSRKYATQGNAARAHDAKIVAGRWLCDLCVVRGVAGDQIGHDHGRFMRLLSLERDRQLRIFAAYADSTRVGHSSGLNKVAAFEREFGVAVLPTITRGLPAAHDEIKIQWCVLYSARKLVTRGHGEQKTVSHIKYSGLDSIRSSISAAKGAIAMHDASIPSTNQGRGGPSSEMRRVFHKGTQLYMGSHVDRPIVLDTAVVADIQLYAALGYRAADKRKDYPMALRMATLCWYAGIMGMVGYRPGDVIHMSREQWALSNTDVDGQQCHRVVLDARDMKGVHNDADHVVVVPGESASLIVTKPGLWIMSASIRMGVSATAPMVSGITQGFDSSTLLVTLLRPALIAIRDQDMKSSALVRDMDIARVNIRSFRRSATKAMRKAGVDPEMVRYIQQWKRRGDGSDMRLHYDEIDKHDTVGAMARI
jgi:hypothetical protein